MRSDEKVSKASGHEQGHAMLTGHVHRHLFNLGAVELFNLSHHPYIISCNKIDSDTFSSKSSTATDTMYVVLAVCWQVIVDNQRDLLDIDAASQKVSCNQDTGGSRSELLHNNIPLILVHFTMHSRNSEVTFGELRGKPVNLSPRVAEDHSLCDSDGFIEIRKGVQLPVFLLDSNIELLDTFKGQLGLLDQDADRVSHELRSDLEDVLRHGGGQQNNLG